MYKLHIQNEKVRVNVALIVEAIRDQKPKNQRKITLEFMIDPKTGLLHSSHIPPSEDLEILIHIDLEQQQVSIIDTAHQKEFDIQQMDPQGRQVLSETAYYLKSALKHLHNIQELAHIEFEVSLDEMIGRNLLHENWHALERNDAEMMLLNTTAGTYLFRKDRFAHVMEEILSSAKQSRIRCFTLSYLDPQKQVREKTIVTWRDHWLFYDDDPTLSGKSFESLEKLLASLGSVLKRPLAAMHLSK